MKLRGLVLALTMLLMPAAHAVEPREMLADPALEARARDVSKALRCVQCQNESIDESHAEIARGMRQTVREHITAGESNEQVIAYMLGRYGDYILLKPRLTATTALLWGGPPIILVLGLIAVRRRLGTARAVPPAPLSAEEAEAVALLEHETVARS